MARPASRPRARRRPQPQPSRGYVAIYRPAIFLPLLAFLAALAVQTVMRAAGLESSHPLRVFATPLIAGGVVFFGLRPYPRGGRLRLAAMVALGLFLFAHLT